MPSYGAVDTKPSDAAQAAADAAASNLESNADHLSSAHSFQEMDMRFLEDKSSKDDRRRKLISSMVPILIAVAIILLFAKVALGAIGPVHDPNYPTEVGSRRPVPTGTATATTTSSTAFEESPVAAPASSGSSNESDGETTTKSSTSGSGSASCSQHKVCDKLGLTGLCCPTGEGVTLGCCN